MELSDRKKKILAGAIEDYIRDCAPITSGGIKNASGLDCSTATLRNELNALESMGFLRQLHTSGGRVPTAQGYRYYVENLIGTTKATDAELDKVKDIITSKTTSLNDIVSGIAKIVSKVTNYPTVVMMDGYENLVVSEFRLVPLLNDKVMVLIGTVAGYITQNLSVKADINACLDASKYLTNHFRGETLGFMMENIKEFESGMHGEIKAFEMVVNSLIEALKSLNSKKYLDVKREGSARILEEENLEDAKKVLNVLEDEEKTH